MFEVLPGIVGNVSPRVPAVPATRVRRSFAGSCHWFKESPAAVAAPSPRRPYYPDVNHTGSYYMSHVQTSDPVTVRTSASDCVMSLHVWAIKRASVGGAPRSALPFVPLTLPDGLGTWFLSIVFAGCSGAGAVKKVWRRFHYDAGGRMEEQERHCSLSD
jgi:hypothetical protein